MAPRPGSGRILFIDLARAIAVLLMVQGHTIDALLHQDFRTSLQYNAWLYLRGLTSCTFLFLSGAAFSLTALRHWDEQRRPSRRALKRVRRLLFFLALGYFVHFPMGKFVHLQFATDERWRSFLAVDVLQNVAVTLLGLQALIALTRTPRQFAAVCAGLAVAIAGIDADRPRHRLDRLAAAVAGRLHVARHGIALPAVPVGRLHPARRHLRRDRRPVGHARPPAAAGPRPVPHWRRAGHRRRAAR